jgi:hypothetical protein
MKRAHYLYAALAAAIGLITVPAGGQAPAGPSAQDPNFVPVPSTTLYEQTSDGKLLRVTQQGHSATYVPLTVDGRAFYPQPTGLDAESQKLLAAEQAAAKEVSVLAGQAQRAESDGERADAKKQLREKLVQIFDLQQQRRNHEIARLEVRLGKLKDTLKKRDAAKDSIVDRRLETLTGGVDELGWEDSFGALASPYGSPASRLPNTTPAPRYYGAERRTAPPATAPRTTAPGYPAPPAVPVPAAPEAAPTPTIPPVAPAPPLAPAPPAPR